jgi:hypothetical protein
MKKHQCIGPTHSVVAGKARPYGFLRGGGGPTEFMRLDISSSSFIHYTFTYLALTCLQYGQILD